LWWLVSGQAFAGQMLAYQGSDLWREMGNFVVQLWRAFFAIGIGPGLLGMMVLLRRDWRLGGMLGLMFVCSAGFYIDYQVIDKDTMFLPAYLLWALWLGVGYQWALDWVRSFQQQSDPINRRVTQLLRGVMIGAVLVALLWNWPLVDLSNDWSARIRGEAILDEVEPQALIFGFWHTVPLVEYLQLVEEQRPDVQAINRFLITPEDMRRLIRREIMRRPIYLDSLPPQWLNFTKGEPAGPIYRLHLRQTLIHPGR
jgi:hypothetical protein